MSSNADYVVVCRTVDVGDRVALPPGSIVVHSHLNEGVGDLFLMTLEPAEEISGESDG